MSAGFDPLYKWLGIPPDEQPPHCYRLLGLEIFESNLDVIEGATDRQMAYLRTFQTGPNVQIAQEVLNQVAVAKSWLLNPGKKVQYDGWLREQLGSRPPPVPAAPPVPPVPPARSAPPVPAPPVQVEEAVADLAEVLGNTDTFVPSRRRTKKGRRRQLMGAAISLMAAVLAVGIFGVVAWKIQVSSSHQGTLEVEWPEEEREGGSLRIDDKPVDVAPGDTMTFSRPSERYKVTFTRPGYEPYELTVAVTAGKTTTVRPVWRKAGAKDDESKVKPGENGDGTAKKSAKDEDEKFSFDKKDKPDARPKRESGDEKNAMGEKKAEPKPADLPKSPEPAARSAVPDEASQEKARKAVRDVYKAQFDAAVKTEDKQALAKRLLQEAIQTENDPVGQYVLLETVAELAVEAGDGLVAYSAVEEMAQRYKIDAVDRKSRILDAFVKKARSPEQHKSVVDEALRLADAALAESRFPLALQLGKLAAREAAKGRDKETIQRTRIRARELEEIIAAYEEVKTATATLAEKPEDPEANLTVGKYHCFARGDWEAGLPMLVKGSDASLKALARRDLEGASVPEAQVALADEWRLLAAKSSGLAKRQMQSRAVYWYRKAIPGLSGPAKAGAERWLKEFGAPQTRAEGGAAK
jgi:hypothetical protein